MTLHNDTTLFEEAILATAEYKQLPTIYVEKDYWVTLALHTLFTNAEGAYAVFKGGTALSKCYQVIERFSEDIDIVVLRQIEESNNQMKEKITNVSKRISEILPEITHELTVKMGMNRKTVHKYAQIFAGDFGQVRDYIVLDATWLGYAEPYTSAQISSFITQMLIQQGQTHLLDKYGLQPFEVRVLKTERTICEKIMGLVRFSFDANPITALNDKVRHIYDLHKLLEINSLNQFFYSSEFEQMLLKVANDDVKSFKNNNRWLSNHPKTAMIFGDTTETWQALRETYHSKFQFLVFGELPSETAILSTLQKIAERLASIEWTIELPTTLPQ